MNKEFNKGLLLAGFGSFWWGFLGVLYFKYITFIGHIELVVHRCLWTTFTLIITTFLFSKWHIFFDIIQNKKTFLVIKALELGSDSQRSRLYTLLSTESSDENIKIKEVKSIFNQLHVREVAESLMEKYLKLAFEHLEAVNVGDERKKVLIGLSHELMGREV